MESLPPKVKGAHYSIQDEVQKVWEEAAYNTLKTLMEKTTKVYDSAIRKQSSLLDNIINSSDEDEEPEQPKPKGKGARKTTGAVVSAEDQPVTKQELQAMLADFKVQVENEVQGQVASTLKEYGQTTESALLESSKQIQELAKAQHETARLVQQMAARHDEQPRHDPPYRNNNYDDRRGGSKGGGKGGKGGFRGSCWNCGRPGHRAADCPAKPKTQMTNYANAVANGEVDMDREAEEQLGANWDAGRYYEAAIAAKSKKSLSWWEKIYHY